MTAPGDREVAPGGEPPTPAPADDVGALALTVVEALERAGIPCAVGGALALGVWGVPRGTTDVDLSAFVEPSGHEALFDALADAGLAFSRDEARRRAADGDTIFCWRDGFRVDVFVPSIPFYAEARRTLQRVRFRGREIPFLGAEALAVFKLLFFRPKDLVDLAGLVAVQGRALDHAWIRGQLEGMLGPEDVRLAAWDRIVATHGPTRP